MSLTLLERFELVSTFTDPDDPYSQEHGIYLLRRWAQVDLVAVVPRRQHSLHAKVPVPAGTKTISLSPINPNAEDWHVSFAYFSGLYPFLLRFGVGPFIDLDVILRAWAREIPSQLDALAAAKQQRRAWHREDYEDIVNRARALASGNKLSIGSAIERALEDVAAAVESATTWLDPFIEDVPRDGKGYADLLLTLHLWAIDQLTDAVNEFRRIESALAWAPGPTPEPQEVKRVEVVRSLVAGWAERNDSPGDAAVWRNRIHRLEQRIRRDAVPNESGDPRTRTKALLMAKVLDELRQLHA